MKGLWIPIEIVKDTSLTATEKFILSDVFSMVSGGLPYFKSNATIALEFNVSQGTVSRSVANLITNGYLVLECFDGRRRQLGVDAEYTKMSTQSTQERVGSIPKNKKAALRKPQHNKQVSKQAMVQWNVSMDTDELKHAWNEWNDEQKKRRKKPYTERAQKMAAKRLTEMSKGDPALAVELINYAILRRWDTFWELPKQHKKNEKGFKGSNFTEQGIRSFIEQG